MSRIQRAFAACAEKNEAALVTYVTAGDPDLETTRGVLAALSRGGADVIELGMPFSDPSADGPAIQAASERALAAGTTFDGVLACVADLRAGRLEGADPEVPVVLFGYLNPLLAASRNADGTIDPSHLARRLTDAGIDGVLAVDLPPEEAGPLGAALGEASVDIIRLLAPTTPEARISRIAEGASGFLYYVSITGVTGAGSARPEDLEPRVRTVRERSGLPVGVGFGIRTPEQAREIAAFADGVVVGSAIVQTIATTAPAEAPAAVEAQVRALKDATRRST